jgi:hypothetical protein
MDIDERARDLKRIEVLSDVRTGRRTGWVIAVALVSDGRLIPRGRTRPCFLFMEQ